MESIEKQLHEALQSWVDANPKRSAICITSNTEGGHSSLQGDGKTIMMSIVDAMIQSEGLASLILASATMYMVYKKSAEA